MRQLRALLFRLAGTFGRRRGDRELQEEIASHLQLHTDDNLRVGMSAAEARREAILKLGGVEPLREEYRDRLTLPWLDVLAQDFRYAARTLRNNPAFALVGILTLGLGIGASTAMFSVFEAALLRPLPYPDPDRLIQISEVNPLKRWTNAPASPANFKDWRAMNRAFTDIAAYGTSSLFLSGAGDPQRIRGVDCTGNLFDVIGVRPLLGRTFAYEETFKGKDRVAILSYDFWQAGFAGDPGIIGRTISLTGANYQVIGVMPHGFFFPDREIRVFTPFGFQPSIFSEQRRPHYLRVLARLRPGVSLPQAADQMAAIARRLEERYPDTNTQMGVRLDGYHDTLVETKRGALMMLAAAVALLFLIVCSNIANLQFGRAASRAREIGIRQALGASRARLVRQFLTESLTFSILGGALGFALAAGARGALLRFAPDVIPRFAELRIDTWVILFNAAITVCAPFLFGLAPAFVSARAETFRERSETASRKSRSMRHLLVASEVAMSVVLAVGAGLLIRSLVRLEGVDPGFDSGRAVSFSLVFPGIRYPKAEQAVRAVSAIEERLRSHPAVKAAGAAMVIGLRGSAWTGDATVEGRAPGDYERELRHNVVTPGYFRAVGTPLVRGRFPAEFDGANSPPVTLVNETLARKYFRGDDAVGKRIKFGRPKDKDDWITVIGVVADQKQDGLASVVQPEAYVPLTQAGADDGIGLTFVVRAAADPDAIVTAARDAVRSVDKDIPLTEVATLRDLVRKSTGDQRFRASLLAGFAGIALFLAALGIYGVLAYAVAQRTREIGVRMALGAAPASLFGAVVRDGLRPVVLGAAVGLASAYFVTGLIEALLFSVTPADPPTYLITLAVVVIASLIACAVPAFRAVRIDPIAALREQ